MRGSDVDDALRQAIPRAEEGDEAGAWAALAPLETVADQDASAARCLAIALAHGGLARDRRRDLARRLFDRWHTEPEVLAALGEATESLADLRYLNAPPPADPLFVEIAGALDAMVRCAAVDEPARVRLVNGLATAARICGRAWDATCERAHRERVARRPEAWHSHYNLGLFLKNRGRFAEALAANQEAARHGGADDDSVIWNLGICATAVGDGEAALSQWRRIGCKLQIGLDALPEGRWDHVQVRLAQRPIAARSASDDHPGAEETVWIERLSPCHGRVVSALFDDEVGVDYGDLVLFDGAPILSRRWGERDVPVFPHLVTLRRGGWRIFPFAATQHEPGEVAAAGERLGDGVVLYAHTEQVRILCLACWERSDPGHAHAEAPHRTVTGKLVVPPEVALHGVAEALTREATDGLRVFVPDLWDALGALERGSEERRGFAAIRGAAPPE